MSLFDVMKSSAKPPKPGFIKALTVHQPHASLIWWLLKQNETRGWATRYRGPIAIHAGMRKMRHGEITPLMDHACCKFTDPFTDCFPRGVILGCFDLWDCVRVGKIITDNQVATLEFSFGNYCDGRYAWRLKPIVTFKRPVPFKGLQGLWDVPEELLPEWVAYKKGSVQHV
jgi:activating signal cointegrator 1